MTNKLLIRKKFCLEIVERRHNATNVSITFGYQQKCPKFKKCQWIVDCFNWNAISLQFFSNNIDHRIVYYVWCHIQLTLWYCHTVRTSKTQNFFLYYVTLTRDYTSFDRTFLNFDVWWLSWAFNRDESFNNNKIRYSIPHCIESHIEWKF